MNPIVIRTKAKSQKVKSSWDRVMSVYNSLPGGVTKCNTIYEAKMYTCVLFIALSLISIIFIAAAIYVYSSSKKGGKQ